VTQLNGGFEIERVKTEIGSQLVDGIPSAMVLD
jgi:hypothetical protein